MIAQEAISLKVIVISSSDDELIILKALKAGAKGFFFKGYELDSPEIYNAIFTVTLGKFYFNELTKSALLTTPHLPQTSLNKNDKVEFSETELDIIRYLSLEMTSEQIAEKTHYTKRSIENIRQELMHRVGARTSIGLVLYAIKHNHIKI